VRETKRAERVAALQLALNDVENMHGSTIDEGHTAAVRVCACPRGDAVRTLYKMLRQYVMPNPVRKVAKK
jgi:hypothetical protein